jgi:phosphatidylserine/phosphatidylglycerophosphate/cardiolipin synthase-like enzyme
LGEENKWAVLPIIERHYRARYNPSEIFFIVCGGLAHNTLIFAGNLVRMPTTYILNSAHYTHVLDKVRGVKRALWIGTADIKDLYVNDGLNNTVPFLSLLAERMSRGVEVRLIHAKEPGQNFRGDFDKYPLLAKRLERALCPRVHFKLMIFDFESAYIGSANLTGAGMGMKGENNRNFEAGILTTEPALVASAVNQFDEVWMGKFCGKCGRKAYCGDTIKSI